MSASFSRRFVIGFSLAVFLGYVGFTFVDTQYVAPALRVQESRFDSGLAKRLSSSGIAGTAITPESAKKRREFWAFDKMGMGISLSSRIKSSHLRELFPGYPATEFSDEFWQEYFSRTFNQRIWVGALSRHSRFGTSVYTSWLGCADIFTRYGADIVLLGDSVANEGLLASGMGQPGEKVLTCSGPAKNAEHLNRLTQIFKSTGKRVRNVLLGYSLRTPFDRKLSFELDPRDEIGLKDFGLLHSSRLALSDFMDFPSWEILFASDWRRWLRFARIEKKETAEAPTVRTFSYELGLPVNDEQAKRNEWLEKLSQNTQLESIEPGCPIEESSRDLDQLLASLRSFSDEILLYVNPTTPLANGHLSENQKRCVREMLLSKKAEKVTVVLGDWKFYGLNYKDFLYLRAGEVGPRINVNHTNFWGAQKVTKVLNQLIHKPSHTYPKS